MEFNKEQKQAINHTKGPLLIIAGAGTGKTRVITSKILDLIESGAAKPAEVLALTFTEKASNEMVERVDEHLPLGYEELCIKTFHSFSEQILREYGIEIGIDSGYKILDQVDQWFFFKQNLYLFELDYYRPLGNPNKFIYDLLNHFNKVKDELITPNEYIKYAEALEDEEKEKMLEVAQAYKRYQNLMLKNNYFDFADLSFYASYLLNKRKAVLKAYQERYKYILVDEFQDTNYAQFELVSLLAAGHENITVVGDDDQSIYKWRGASLSNILKFEEDFAKHKKIVLTENYRNPDSIIKSSYKLIQNNNPDRLEVRANVDKNLKCNNPHKNPVEVHHFPSFIQEAEFVAEKIEALRKEKVALNEIAILVRSNHLTTPFTDEFKYRDIPYQIKNPKGLLKFEEIKDLIAVVNFLANPYDDVALLRILKMDIFDIEMDEILRLLNNANNKHLYSIIKGTESPFQKVYELLSELVEFSKKNPIGLVLNEFIQKSGYLDALISNNRFEEMENINQFAGQISKFEKDHEQVSAIDFNNYLTLLYEANSTLKSDGLPDKNAVQILTAHGAKGLQFDHVFIVNAVSQRFPTSKRRESLPIPTELTKEIFPEGDFHIQEERRLFYVAMTRAKKNLFITYSDLYEGNKKWKVSPFIEELMIQDLVVLKDHKEEKDAIKKLKEFKTPKDSSFKLPEFNPDQKLSYSQLGTFKTCPLKYNYQYLMRVPVPQSHAANFGTSVHNTLKEFYKILKIKGTADFKLMKEIYLKNWISYGYESAEHELLRRNKGLEVLENFYKENSDPWVLPAFLEKPFNIKIEGHWLSGRIDRIDELEDGTYEVIDYKTGRIPSTVSLKKDLQLSLYHLACSKILGLKVSKLSLYYLEDNEKLTTSRSEDDLAGIEKEITDLIEEMKASPFHSAPGFLCRFCDFRLICPDAA